LNQRVEGTGPKAASAFRFSVSSGFWLVYTQDKGIFGCRTNSSVRLLHGNPYWFNPFPVSVQYHEKINKLRYFFNLNRAPINTFGVSSKGGCRKEKL
jgi:hypothetical protein